jgi:hypothetical protein
MTETNNNEHSKKQAGYWKKYYTEERKEKLKNYYQTNKLKLKLKREQNKGNENITLDDIEIFGRGQPKLPEEKKEITKRNYEKLQRLIKNMQNLGITCNDIQEKAREYENELIRRNLIKA